MERGSDVKRPGPSDRGQASCFRTIRPSCDPCACPSSQPSWSPSSPSSSVSPYVEITPWALSQLGASPRPHHDITSSIGADRARLSLFRGLFLRMQRAVGSGRRSFQCARALDEACEACTDAELTL